MAHLNEININILSTKKKQLLQLVNKTLVYLLLFVRILMMRFIIVRLNTEFKL